LNYAHSKEERENEKEESRMLQCLLIGKHVNPEIDEKAKKWPQWLTSTLCSQIP
jgi:hypothetical protein